MSTPCDTPPVTVAQLLADHAKAKAETPGHSSTEDGRRMLDALRRTPVSETPFWLVRPPAL